MPKRKRERRKPGSGYTSEAANGTWIAHFPKFGGGYHVRRGFDTRPHAEAWLDSLLAQREKKGDVGSGQKRLSVWIDTWATRAARERGWKAKMVADVVWKLGYVKPYLGNYALSDVRADDVDAVWDELRKSLAETTVRQIRNYFWQVFDEARERHYITYNPVIKPKRHKRAAQREPQRLTVAQTVRVLREAEGSFYSLAWWLIFTLGLRAGELCGLRWGDIDFDKATVTISQAVGDVRGKPTAGLPKGDKVRTLPLPRSLVAPLRSHKQAYTRRAAQGQQKGYWHENGLVFPGRGGKPMHTTSLRHQFRRLTDACRLPPIHTHDARHTAAKFYTDLGATTDITAAILGHGPRTITGHYAPHDVEVLRPWVERVYGMLAGETEKIRKEGTG